MLLWASKFGIIGYSSNRTPVHMCAHFEECLIHSKSSINVSLYCFLLALSLDRVEDTQVPPG
jgi:hypothetical protein